MNEEKDERTNERKKNRWTENNNKPLDANSPVFICEFIYHKNSSFYCELVFVFMLNTRMYTWKAFTVHNARQFELIRTENRIEQNRKTEQLYRQRTAQMDLIL